jgi:RimJ/RimL family protein N-acetyltransferase
MTDPMRLLHSPRCTLEPLVAAHAEAMFAVLSDPALYEFENAAPVAVEALRDRYRWLERRGPPDGGELWLNWVLRLPDGELCGVVQATVLADGQAWVAYELGSRHWRQGIGSGAVRAMLQELADHHGVHTAVAALKAANHRSAGLLRHLGFRLGLPPESGLGPIEADEIAFHLPLQASPTPAMTIEHLFIRPPGGGPQQALASARLVAGAGIEGDRYFGAQDEPGQNLTLVEAEAIEAFVQAHGRAADYAITGRNVVTRGVRLNDLVGRTFTLGGVRCRGVELCEPCLGLGEALQAPDLAPPQVVRWWAHRGGLRADVVDGGTLVVGAALVVDAQPAGTPGPGQSL